MVEFKKEVVRLKKLIDVTKHKVYKIKGVAIGNSQLRKKCL